MRLAIVSDIHGNLTAFEAVLRDLRATAPDLIFHGGDLADAGSSPVEIVDRIRDLAWPGIVGNTDEMLFQPESLAEFAAPLPTLRPMFDAIADMAACTRAALGEDRLAWLRDLPRVRFHDSLALVHALPADCWRAPQPEAGDAELEAAYAPLARPLVVYAHIHRPFVRKVGDFMLANTGSVGLSYDGDCRAAYLLLDGLQPTIRRVEYDIDREANALADSRFPRATWIARILRSARPQPLSPD